MPRVTMHSSLGITCLLAAAISVAVGCEDRSSPEPGLNSASGTTTTAQSPRRVVATSFYPTAFFAERIAGSRVTVVCPCPNDEDPAAWTPAREAIETYQQASLVVLNGAGLERWTGSASLPESRVVVTTDAFKDRLLKTALVTHSHGPGGAHSHHGVDAHTWLDPNNAILQAQAVRDALARAWPDDAAAFNAGMEALRAQLVALDARFRALTPPAKSSVLFASHPAYAYIASRYGWTFVALDLEPGEQPSAADWKSVATTINAASGTSARVMLFEQEPAPPIRERLLNEFGIESLMFDACEQPGFGDYIDRMNGNLDRLTASLAAGSANNKPPS